MILAFFNCYLVIFNRIMDADLLEHLANNDFETVEMFKCHIHARLTPLLATIPKTKGTMTVMMHEHYLLLNVTE